jgi:hypothetical protein
VSGASSTTGFAIHEPGEVAGIYADSAFGPNHGFVYDNGTFPR